MDVVVYIRGGCKQEIISIFAPSGDLKYCLVDVSVSKYLPKHHDAHTRELQYCRLAFWELSLSFLAASALTADKAGYIMSTKMMS